MDEALVLGASGGMGYSIVKELSERGIKVKAFARNEEKLHKLFGQDLNVSIHNGDVFCLKDLETAATGVDVIFHAINIPYGDWQERLMELTRNVIATAKIQSTKLAVVDNIYAYGKSPGNAINESFPKNPHTKKGKLRLQMDKLIEESGVPYVIAHFPDFYGPYVENGYINYTLRQILSDKKASFIGSQSIAREYIYTPDGAKALVELSLNDNAYGDVWNVPAYDVITGQEVLKIIGSTTGYNKKVSTVTKNMIRLIGLFNKQMREFAEMQYLNENPLVLSGEKYEENIGPVPRTSYEDGIKKTIEATTY